MNEEAKKLACTPEVRALEVEKAIWREIDAGRIQLRHGTYGEINAKPCQACALGSAAMAICGIDVSDANRPNSGGMRNLLENKGVMTRSEAFQLEWGFEHASTENGAGPFFQLGLRLRERRRPGAMG